MESSLLPQAVAPRRRGGYRARTVSMTMAIAAIVTLSCFSFFAYHQTFVGATLSPRTRVGSTRSMTSFPGAESIRKEAHLLNRASMKSCASIQKSQKQMFPSLERNPSKLTDTTRSAGLTVAAAGEAVAAPGSGNDGPIVSDSQNKGTILVVGATGTLGRQIVRKALSDGYNVRCLVRSRFESEEARRVLQGWGATIVGGDLGQATSIPPAMLGVDTVIDCATARPEEPLRRVDWDGKVALIETAQALGVKRFIFFSIDKCEQYPEVKLMDMKAKTENYLAETDLDYTVFRMCGFMQALISSYAIPIVEGENVWGTDSGSEIAYINSLDAARLALAAVDNEKSFRETLVLSGPESYTTQQVIDLCEKFSGSDAKVINAPGFFLKGIRSFLNLFKWAQDAADRLAFSEVISQNTVLSGDMKKTCEVLGVEPESLTTLPSYLESFFTTILSKVQKIKKSEYVSTAARDLEI
mmetsp:Transcript_17107/g.25643  ORF Transcript_17107/g.25643 Transcript_17107/m.25643 type:complete len:469 (+) Transcript_17107:64-1470(+)